MEGLSLSKKPVVVKAIFISIFFHAAILGTVIFSFPISQGQPRPFFVFLGSILSRQDFIFPKGNAHPGARIQPSLQILIVSKHPLYPAPILKPSFQINISNPGKTLLKMKAFLAADQPEDKNSSETIKKSLGVESKIPPYAPLKLYTK